MNISNILLATPCSHGVITTDFYNSAMQLMRDSHTRFYDPIFIETMTYSLPEIYKTRNAFAAYFMEHEDYTHLLMIDSDIGFDSETIFKMFEYDKPFVAALCPRRKLDIELFYQLSRKLDDPALAERIATSLVAQEQLIEKPDIDGFARTNSIGAGIMLLSREVFTKLRNVHTNLIMPISNHPYYSVMNITQPVLQCFAPYKMRDNSFLSEDNSFCKRWRDLGEDIWVYTKGNVTHTGKKVFESSYSDHLKYAEIALDQTEP